MIADAVRLLANELNAYISAVDPDPNQIEFVRPGHIALAENADATDEGTLGQVILSVVNIEEEKRLKNVDRVQKVEDTFQLQNPPIHLNLYLLFSASINPYEMALHRISQVIEFFQGKFVFTVSNSPGSIPAGGSFNANEFKLILDIHTLNFEQINDLWGSLGGKQVPFVVYRVRLIEMKREAQLESGPFIREINEESN